VINKPTTPDVAVKREAPDEDPPLLLPLLDAAVAVFDGLAVAIAPTPPVNTVPVGSVTSLVPMAKAFAMKFVKVLLPLAGALMEPTIPIPQCWTCLQWNQMG